MDKISDVAGTLKPAWATAPEASEQPGAGQPVPDAPLRSEQRTTPLLDRLQFTQDKTLPAADTGLRFRERESASSEDGSISSEEDSLDAAMSQQDPAAIEAALLSGVDLARRAREQPMLLHAMAGLGNVNGVRLLLDAGVDVNLRSSQRRTPLIHAAAGGSAQIIEVLLDHGAAAGKRDDAGNTALHVAVLCRQQAAAAALLGRMSQDEIEQENRRGYSALFEAVWLEDAAMTRLLLHGGARVDCHSQENAYITPLMLAAARGNAEVLDDLLAAGAKPDEPDWMSTTALFYAVRGGNLVCIEALLDAGANVNARDTRCSTPLLCAIEASKAEAVHALLRHGAAMTHHARLVGNVGLVSCRTEDAEFGDEGDPSRRTLAPARRERVPQPALLLAVSKGLDEMTALLLDAGADVNFIAAGGDTALTRAEELGHHAIVERLLAHGAQY
ncbi:MAG: ankyrin repeat domain-containing protein [Burkholderiaceae bacterium]